LNATDKLAENMFMKSQQQNDTQLC